VTTLVDQPPAAPAPGADDVPREITPGRARTDRVFVASARTIGALVLLITGSIGLFLGLQLIPTVQHYGLSFFTEQQWNPERNVLGISAVIAGTITVAVIALVIGFPLALGVSLYVSEYAPPKLKSFLVSLLDLMVAVPSIVYGLCGLFLLEPRIIYLSRWLHTYLGWIPIFHVETDPHAAAWEQTRYYSSAFIAGVVVSLMVIPMAAAVMRGVFSQTPIGEREGALALGATRWGVIRSVVLPFGRGGIIGGTMLGLGRALGETIAVTLIISVEFLIKPRILEVGTITTSSLIATLFGEATSTQLSALLAAGFVLFMMTLLVNLVAGMIVTRSRSGAATEL
jgi:phosphate transport system permease protein